LAKALELLSLAPRQELGTIASQNSDNVNITGGLISGLDAPLPVASGGIGVTTAAANQVFAGPTAGAAAAPAFRALVAADIPALTSGTSILYGNGTGGFSNVTIGTGVSFAAGTLSATGSGGTVTSVTGTSPVVSSGGITPAISLATGYGDTQNPYASKTANYFLAAPNGSAGAPTFRAMVAADVPTLNQNTTGTASNVTGTVAIANGGTGATTDSGARTNLGATTVGSNLFTLTNPSAVTYMRINADNSVSTLDAATFRTAIGAGTGSGTVTAVTASSPLASSGGTAPNITITGSALTKTDDTNVTLTLGGTPASSLLAAASLTLGWTGTLAVSRGGIGTGTAGIGAFNNITGYTASGATGTTSTNLVFSTSPTLTTPKATTTIGVGNATPSASGAGISFPATQSASTDPNTLDDYEEGTWTATLKGFSTAGTYQLVNNDNYYTKIGNKVFLQCRIRLDTITGGGAGFAVISGLPFSKRSASMAVGALWHINVDYPAGALTGSPCVSFYTFSSSSELYFPLNISGSISEISITGFNSFDYMNFSIDYEVS
jgi:hypothetical protein